MVKFKLKQPVPHPTRPADLRAIIAKATGPLRTAYILTAFAGLRCGEICALRWEDIELDSAEPTAPIHGKGGKERRVPLLASVIDEFSRRTEVQRGPVIARSNGRP